MCKCQRWEGPGRRFGKAGEGEGGGGGGQDRGKHGGEDGSKDKREVWLQ